MSSVFKKTEEELKVEEIETMKFTTLLESKMKRCNLDGDLELLLYDISDAIKDNHILLVEAKDGREEAYLIPLLVAYQNTTFFKHFTIVTASNKTGKKIVKRLKELSKTLGVNIPIHILENEKNYLCLKRLNGYNKKRKKPLVNVQREKIKKEEWRKIQVRNCTLSSCKFFKFCRYALAYTSINQAGCSIISHSTLIGNRKFSQTAKINQGSNIIIIDEAEKFASNIQDSYQQLMSYDYICNCLSRAKTLLNRKEYSYITNEDFNTLQLFFEELAKCEKGFDWKITEELRRYSIHLSALAKQILIHLTRQYAIKSFSRDTENFCDSILIIGRFFEDIAKSTEKFRWQIQEKERSETTLDFRKIQIFYYPKQVDTIIADRLRNETCSIVFTGKNIAGKDGAYQQLVEECGLEQIEKPKVKEYIPK